MDLQEESEQNKNDVATILHPELMSNEELTRHLLERNVKSGSLRLTDKAHLIELFYKTVVPQPQRKYRANRRGRIMARQQIIREKRKRSHNESNFVKFDNTQSHTKSNTLVSSTNSGTRCSLNVSVAAPVRERLKPPPSITSSERKVIRLKPKTNDISASCTSTKEDFLVNSVKLGTTSSATVSSSSEVCKSTEKNLVKVLPQKSERNSTNSDKPTKPIKLRRNKDSIGTETVTSSTDISNTSSDIKGQEKQDTDNLEEEPVTKKFKKISITWP